MTSLQSDVARAKPNSAAARWAGRLGHIGNSAQLNDERQIEDFRRRHETERVRLAHKTCANKPRA